MNSSIQSRVPHLRDGLIVSKVGIALRATALFCLAIIPPASHAQSVPCGITHLPPTTAKLYPPIAKAAHVGGTVILLAAFDHDGTPKVTKIVSGPEMLKKSAVQFIETSQADPSTGTRECPIVLSFELTSTSCDAQPEPDPPFTAKDPQHMVLYATAMMICDPSATITRTRNHFLFVHWYSKPVIHVNE